MCNCERLRQIIIEMDLENQALRCNRDEWKAEALRLRREKAGEWAKMDEQGTGQR